MIGLKGSLSTTISREAAYSFSPSGYEKAYTHAFHPSTNAPEIGSAPACLATGGNDETCTAPTLIVGTRAGNTVTTSLTTSTGEDTEGVNRRGEV